jgi:hypothetical protein
MAELKMALGMAGDHEDFADFDPRTRRGCEQSFDYPLAGLFRAAYGRR